MECSSWHLSLGRHIPRRTTHTLGCCRCHQRRSRIDVEGTCGTQFGTTQRYLTALNMATPAGLGAEGIIAPLGALLLALLTRAVPKHKACRTISLRESHSWSESGRLSICMKNLLLGRAIIPAIAHKISSFLITILNVELRPRISPLVQGKCEHAEP